MRVCDATCAWLSNEKVGASMDGQSFHKLSRSHVRESDMSLCLSVLSTDPQQVFQFPPPAPAPRSQSLID